MSARCSISYFSSCHMCLLILLVLLSLCLSDQKSDDVLCIDGERQALIRFKDNLVDEAGRLASWVGEKTDCCRWAGIVCDNITGHVHEIYLRGLDGHCDPEDSMQMLRGNLSPSLLELKQLEHLDLSCNDFEEIQIPSFIGSLKNLRYLNLSKSSFGGIIPPKIGNLSELRVLSLGSLYEDYPYSERTLTSTNMQWLSSLRWLQRLDMSSINLSKATDWFQLIKATVKMPPIRNTQAKKGSHSGQKRSAPPSEEEVIEYVAESRISRSKEEKRCGNYTCTIQRIVQVLC